MIKGEKEKKKKVKKFSSSLANEKMSGTVVLTSFSC